MQRYIFLLLTVALFSCGASRPATGEPEGVGGVARIENPEMTITLIDHLRKVPGIMISGSGPDASITIRGVSSFLGSSEPLFVLDGQPLTGGLRAAVELVPVQDIKSINVLKNAGDTGIYGVRGANGVIEIYLK